MNLVYDFLFIVGIIFSVGYMYVLSKAASVNLSKYILIAFFGIVILVLLESYAYIHQIKWLKYTCFTLAYGSKIAIGPLLIAYIQSLFFEDKTVYKKNKYALVPYLLFTLVISVPYAIAKLFEGYFTGHIQLIENYSQYIRVTLDILLLVYLYQAFIKFKKFKKIVQCNYSNVEEKNFIWVRYLLVSVSTVIAIDLVVALSQILFDLFPIRTQNIIMSLTAVCIIIAAHYGVNQSKVLVPYFLLEPKQGSAHKENTLSEIQKEEYRTLEASLYDIMETQKPYLDEELTLHKLATHLKVSDKKLSTLLNQHSNTSFYSFVNSFRLNEFKNRLQDEQYKDLTIEGIAYECGFKSKSSFYRLFKKETGISPSEYKKSLQ